MRSAIVVARCTLTRPPAPPAAAWRAAQRATPPGLCLTASQGHSWTHRALLMRRDSTQCTDPCTRRSWPLQAAVGCRRNQPLPHEPAPATAAASRALTLAAKGHRESTSSPLRYFSASSCCCAADSWDCRPSAAAVASAACRCQLARSVASRAVSSSLQPGIRHTIADCVRLLVCPNRAIKQQCQAHSPGRRVSCLLLALGCRLRHLLLCPDGGCTTGSP